MPIWVPFHKLRFIDLSDIVFIRSSRYGKKRDINNIICVFNNWVWQRQYIGHEQRVELRASKFTMSILLL
ncbi:hypothetical protein BGP78_11080 [Pseudoalteromonas sp. MSK9-3]|nr:hypothetical protein BGP78_11080 [Pseudoalteromonas sp. MSK9-3]